MLEELLALKATLLEKCRAAKTINPDEMTPENRFNARGTLRSFQDTLEDAYDILDKILEGFEDA